MTIGWQQALAWRMERQFLDGPGDHSVEDVVSRLTAVPASSGDPELAVGLRRQRSDVGDLAAAHEDGTLIKTYAFRGATHLMTPELASVYLALRSAGRQWELPSWQSYYDLAPSDWEALRAVVREALSDGPLTPLELAAAVAVGPRFRHLSDAFIHKSQTFLKPFGWQGDLSFGPVRDGGATLQALDSNPRWPGVAELDQAGPRAIVAYLSAYGPATRENLRYWLAEGLSAGAKRIVRWTAELGDQLTDVDVDGEPALCLTEHVDELAHATASAGVRLLPGYDQWVLGSGTADPHVVPPERRADVTRGANIAIAGGRISGTWKVAKAALAVTWFGDLDGAARVELDQQTERIATRTNRELRLEVIRG